MTKEETIVVKEAIGRIEQFKSELAHLSARFDELEKKLCVAVGIEKRPQAAPAEWVDVPFYEPEVKPTAGEAAPIVFRIQEE